MKMYIYVLYILYNLVFEVKEMIKFDKLFERLEAEGKSSTYWLRQNGVHPTVVNKLKKDGRVNIDTIDKLCELLDCQPGDLMEYVREE